MTKENWQKKADEFNAYEKKIREELTCKKCGLAFFDNYNMICLSALGFCLKCANTQVNNEDREKFNNART